MRDVPPPWFKVQEAWCQRAIASGVSGTALRLALFVAQRTSRRHQKPCLMSCTWLAKALGVSTRRVRQAREEAVAARLIRWEQTGRWESAIYWIPFDNHDPEERE